MNKTVTVNIGGIVFHIDENAYERFKLYLESIRMHFTTSEGRDEIMQDIESRIAEMFQERIKDLKQVITLTDVEEVTALMGKPEDFGDDDPKEKVKEESTTVLNIKRRLFRNPDDKLLGGVCSGISAYFDIDPVWIRLIFAFSFFVWGSGILLYILLWVIVPEAETTADKLQMKGEPVTVSNIEKNVQEELEQLKKRIADTSIGKKSGNIVTRFFEAIGQLFRLFFMLIGKIIAVFFLFIGLIVAFVVFASILAVFKVPGTQYPEILNQIFPYSYQFGLAYLGAVLVVGIPFIMLAYFGARVLFNVRKTSRTVNMSVIGLWIAGIFICAILGFSIAKDFAEKQSIRKSINLIQPASKTMVLKMDKKYDDEKFYDQWDENEWNGDLRLSIKENQLQSRDINLDIVESNTDSFELIQICYARGVSRKEAADHATRIAYTFNQSDSVLTFNPFFIIDKDEKYHAQKMQLILRVPRGGKIYLDKSLRGFMFDIKNTQNIYDSDMLNRKWEMSDDGLKCLDCDGTENSIGGNDIHISGHGGRIDINDDGVYIEGPDADAVSIDSNGVVIRKNGKVKTYKKGDVHIRVDESN